MRTIDPLDARRWFTRREPVAWVVSGAMFIASFFLLTHFCDALLAFVIAIAGALCLFIYLNTRAIGIKCSHCGNYLSTNTPWICGNKDTPHRNDQFKDFPFIYQCQHCGFIPKAYECHHCYKLIFLSEDKQQTAYAKCADIPPQKPEPVTKSKKMEVADELQEGIQVTKLELEKARLDVELKALNKDLAPPPKEKTAFEELEEYYKGMMGNEDAAKKWHAAIDAEFPNDPVERKKRHGVVDQWMTNHCDK
jgi:hypothetical protein